MHEFMEAEPISSRYFPGSHSKHKLELGRELYNPFGQSRHWVEELCSLAEAPASGRNFPAWQDSQAEMVAEPAFALYLPLPQIWQEASDVPRASE